MFDISGQLICMGTSRTYVVNSGSLITEFVGASIIGIPSVESTQVKLQEQLVPMISIWVSWAMTPMFTTLKRRKPHRIGSLICRTIKIGLQSRLEIIHKSPACFEDEPECTIMYFFETQSRVNGQCVS